MYNPYLELTAELNRGRLRALLSSGQAVVMYRLAFMSKDGDWILREDEEALTHTLAVLAARGTRYRFGAPLDVRWLAGGWSSHFELRHDTLRLRADFVTRPPRLSAAQLAQTWRRAERAADPVIDLEPLIRLKLTKREKDYPVVGELARLLPDPRLELLYSRSARDLLALAERFPDLVAAALEQRPLLAATSKGREALEVALDHERRQLMRDDEDRLARYRSAAEPWAACWLEIEREVAARPLPEAHRILVTAAEGVLPFAPSSTDAGQP